MLKNYLLVAFRSMMRNKVFSFINIIGLALGMACSLLIMLWVMDELHVDQFNKNTAQLYSVYAKKYLEDKVDTDRGTPGVLADEMKRVLPEVQYACGFTSELESTFQVKEKILKKNGSYAGADVFKMFSYPLLAGNAANALSSPTGIAISRKMAGDFFGSPQAAIGKSIRYNNKTHFTITAVFENVPDNAAQKFDYLLNWHTFLEENPRFKEWTNSGPRTYLLLRAGTDPVAFEKKIVHFLRLYNEELNEGFRIELGIQRFDEVYLHSRFSGTGALEGGRIEYVRLFSIVAVFILLIACINFMNLTTARSVKRAKEIGVRKVVGAFRAALVQQFAGEALLLAFISMSIAVALVALCLPAFNQLTQKQIAFPLSNITFWASIVGLMFITGCISGSYPALFLSSFKPVSILKGTLKFSPAATWFRKGLVVFQFVLSIILIIGTIVVSRQINYIQTKNLGYDRESLIYLPLEGSLRKQYDVFKQQALSMPGITMVSRISRAPTQIQNNTHAVEWEGKDPTLQPRFSNAAIDYDFVKTMNIQVLQGREYTRDFATDTAGYIINEQALIKIGYKDPIGKPITFWGRKGNIIGVVKDFHFNSLHVPVKALIMRFGKPEDYTTLLVKTQPGKTKEALAHLEKLCKELNPEFPFTYKFSNDEYAKLYKGEQVTGKLADYFAFLGIFISCLGLLGLSIFTAEQRTKEIGIRKVLGASVSSLFVLLSREFLSFVVIALLIASPLAWLAMNKWLQGYAYSTPMRWWMFVIAGGLAILIALVTVGFQSIKAALANPVKSLRAE